MKIRTVIATDLNVSEVVVRYLSVSGVTYEKSNRPINHDSQSTGGRPRYAF